MASTSHLVPAADPKVEVTPRQGPNNKNGYNGWVEWGQNKNGTWYVDTWGEIWNQAGGTSYVYVEITTTSGSVYNYKAGSAAHGTTKGVDWTAPVEFIDPPASIYVTVCTQTSTSWSCGPSAEALGPA
jgi:hypothetical protein